MKKILIFLSSLFFLTNCSVAPIDAFSFFIEDLADGNYYLVEYASEDTGKTMVTTNVDLLSTTELIVEVPVFETVARINPSSKLLLIASNGSYTGSLVHNSILYTYNHMHSTNSAVYSYTFNSRSGSTSFTAYIGFIVQNNGLFVAKRKNSDAGTTLESTKAFYSESNIDFSAVDGPPLYQKLGTKVTF